MARPVLYLIDGHAVAYRQFHALPEAGFSTKSGEITNAVYGFTRILMDILLDKQPKYLAVTFDRGLSGREEYYPDYKGTREKMPESLGQQIERIFQVVDAFNIPILAIDGMEADDIIGTTAMQALAQDVDVHIITGDRDILQLLTENLTVQLPAFKGRPDDIYNVAKFTEKYGILPPQLVDLKALMGDTSDNIPGVKGIGEKGGTTLVQQYGSLDGIYEHINEIKGSTQQKLIDGKESAYLSLRLARIIKDLPITLELSKCVAQDFDIKIVEPLFRELEFRSLYDRLDKYRMDSLPLFKPKQLDLGLTAEDEGHPQPVEVVPTIVVQDQATLDALAQRLNAAQEIVWDVETTSVDQMAADLVGIAIAVDEETGYYIPVGHQNAAGEQLSIEVVVEALNPSFTNPNIPKYAHNAVYDLVVTQRNGIDVTPIAFDSMLAEWIRDPLSKFMGLKNFARQYLEITMTEIDELIGKGKNQRTMAEAPIDHAAKYAAADAVVTMKAVHFLQNELEDNSKRLLREIDMPLVPVVASMERQGVEIDVPHLKEMSVRLEAQVKSLEEQIYEMSGVGKFNINSTKQLGEVLFDEDKLNLSKEKLRKTTHGYSTDAATLDSLRGSHPIIEKIEEHRELVKLKNTYIDALPQLVNPKTGRIHTNYNQAGSATGRFSSSNPNLQNIPIRSELGREVRRAFIAPEGHVLLGVDYSQIELRVMAHISEDQTLMEAFEAGQDIHRATASAIFDIAPEDVDFNRRDLAKRINFGLIYGMGARRLAKESGIAYNEATHFIERYFQRLPGVKQYLSDTEAFAKEHGYVQTLEGRKRHFPHLKDDRTSGDRVAAELRAAINSPIQGSAADILKIAMIKLFHELKASGLKAAMMLQVHDELVLEVPENELDKTARLVLDVMQDAYKLKVPLVANAEVGKNWRDMEDWK
jgi:DNA polymerase-1